MSRLDTIETINLLHKKILESTCPEYKKQKAMEIRHIVENSINNLNDKWLNYKNQHYLFSE